LSSGTLGVFDCRDPANPLLIRHVQLPNAAAGFEIEGDRLFVTGTAGVLVFDVSDPGSPLPIGWSTFSCDEVIADNGEIFACSEVGLRILPSPCPGVPLDEQAGVEPSALPAVGKTLGPPVPNPSRRSVTIRLSADVPSGTPAEVVDARGRRIRRLFTGSAGSPGLRWDGRDDRGRKTPSGVYTIVLHTPGGDRSVQLQRLP
jgi:hypothetical protein